MSRFEATEEAAEEREPLIKAEEKDGEVILDVKEAETELGPSLEDYEDLVRKMLQKGAHTLGPKAAKGAKVAGIIADKMTTMADKAKALVVSEITDTAGSVARALELDELMLLFDTDAAMSVNFPPLSILLAGVLVPVNLTISMVCHLSQVFLVLLPVLIVSAYSEYADWDSPCKSIPGLRIWARVVGVLAFLIATSRILQVVKISAAKKEIQRKSEEMKESLGKAEAAASSGLGGVEDLKRLFTMHATTLQTAVACEGRTRVNIFAHVIGFGTLLWLLTVFWNLYLYFGYMFVPGVVAFAEAAKDDPSYCAAWVTVCTAKISIILALLFFFANIMTVFFWATETSLSMDSVASQIVATAKAFDNASLGLPVAQILVKAFLLRGATDVLCARLAAQVREKSDITKDLMDTESRLAALKKQLDAKEDEVSSVKQEMIACGGTIGEVAERLSASPTTLKEQGAEFMEEARRQAAALENSTAEEIEKIVAKIKDMLEQAAAAAEEARQQAVVAAEEAQKQAMEAAEQAQEQGLKAAEEAKAKALEAAEQARQAAGDAASQAEQMAKTAAAEAEGHLEQVKAMAK